MAPIPETDLDPQVHRRSAPPFVPASREVIDHTMRQHSDRCGVRWLEAVSCPCRRSIAGVCDICRQVIYLVAERGSCCEHTRALGARRIPILWWPTS